MYNIKQFQRNSDLKIQRRPGGITIWQAMLNYDLNVNPNLTYDIIDKQIADARETFLPVKTVRFNKHKHKKKSYHM